MLIYYVFPLFKHAKLEVFVHIKSGQVKQNSDANPSDIYEGALSLLLANVPCFSSNHTKISLLTSQTQLHVQGLRRQCPLGMSIYG